MYDVLLDTWGGIFPRLGSTGVRTDESFFQAARRLGLGPWHKDISPLHRKRTKKSPLSFHYVTLASVEEYYAYYEPAMKLEIWIKGVSPVGFSVNPRTLPYGLEHAIKLLSQPWWNRMWTLQESVLCEDVVMLSKTYRKTLPIQCFETAAYFVYFSISLGVPAEVRVSFAALRSVLGATSLRQRIADARKDWAREDDGVMDLTLALLPALEASHNRKASDPKDKIIGLLGLVGDRRQELGLTVEYIMPVWEIYSAAFAAALREQGDLYGLGLLTELPEARNPSLPSWVPDFQLHSETKDDHLLPLSGLLQPHDLYNASRVHIGSSHGDVDTGRIRRELITTKFNNSVLILRGVLFDRVKRVGCKAPGLDEIRDGTWVQQMSQTVLCWRDMIQNRVQNGASDNTGSVYESPMEAFWRTFLVDLKQNAVSSLERLAVKPSTGLPPSLTPPLQDESTGPPPGAWGASRLDTNDTAWIRLLDVRGPAV